MDDGELEEYVSFFPEEEYIICDVPVQGKFYIEPFKRDVIKNVLRFGLPWQPCILDVIYQFAQPGTTVLDIGAHIGTFTLTLSKIVGENGCVYAFEPQKKIYRELRKNCELNGVKNALCYRLAIGDRQQMIEMDKETLPHNEGGTSIGRGGDAVEMRTIDSFQLTHVSFIKIDVEGSEQQVLDGMIDTIQKNKPVIVLELQGGHLLETASQEIQYKIVHAMETLEAWGYVVVRIWTHDYLALPVDPF